MTDDGDTDGAPPVLRRPTMKDVARHAGVSLSTVSYVVNDSGSVAPSRRARVLDAVRVLDYTPNESARRLKRRTTAAIGLVVPDLTNQFFALVAEGVERAAAERDVLVVLCAPEATDRPEPLHAKLLQGQRLDGVIYLSGAGAAPSVILDLARSGPVVLVDERFPGFPLPAVVSDSRRGAREVAAYVLAQGHRRLAIIGGPPVLWTAEQRLAGYREAIAAAGMEPDAVPMLVGDYRQESGLNLARELLDVSAGDRPTAILCANDQMAMGVIEYCRSVRLALPDELSVVGFDDVPIARLVTPGLTTVRQPAREMGYRATELLFARLDAGGSSGDGQLEPEPFPVTVQIRDSVASPAR